MMNNNFSFIFSYLETAVAWVTAFVTGLGYKDEADYIANRPYKQRMYPGVFFAARKNGRWGVTINNNGKHTAITLPESLSSFTYAVAFAMAIEDMAKDSRMFDLFLRAHGWVQGHQTRWNTGALYVRFVNDKFYVYRPVLGEGYTLIPNPKAEEGDDGGYENFAEAVFNRNKQLYNLIAINKDPRVPVWREELANGYFKAIDESLDEKIFVKRLASALKNAKAFTSDAEMVTTLDACIKTLRSGTPYKGRFWLGNHIKRLGNYLEAACVNTIVVNRITTVLYNTIGENPNATTKKKQGKVSPTDNTPLTPEELAKAVASLNRKWGH